MTTLTAPQTLGDVLKHEYAKDYCRESVTIEAGAALPVGTVLGRITASGVYTPSPAASVTGKEGAEIACAVLIEDVAASGDARKAVVIARGPAIVADAALVFDTSVDDAAKRQAKLDQLAAHGIVARVTV